jgi:2,3-bisphosphoglycerate-dependent phosphoglycerate mutase
MSCNSDNLPRPFQLGLPCTPPLEPLIPLAPGIFPILLPHPVELHVMRHGESAANEGRLITGSMNVPLTKLGRKQARQAGRKLAQSYDVAFSSTLFRSKETLQLALKARKLEAVCIRESPHIAERQLGELELQSARPIPEYGAGDFSYAPPGGESYLSVTGRTLHFLADVARWIETEWHQGHRKIKRILLCTHMGPMRIIAGILNEESDPVRVLSRSYSPTQLSVFHWCQIAYPKFLLDHAPRNNQPSRLGTPT